MLQIGGTVRVLFNLPALLDVMPPEVFGYAAAPAGSRVMIWVQVQGVHTGPGGAPVVTEPAVEPRGPTGTQIEDRGGIRIVLAAVAGHERVTAVAVAHAHGRG